jgi:hypothetical protein
MIKFNPEGKKVLSYSEIGEPAMKIKQRDEASQYINDYIEWIITNFQKSEDEATDIAKSNLGYWSGYYSHDERLDFQEIFGIEHPIFGSKTPTAKEAFEMGVKFSKNNK